MRTGKYQVLPSARKFVVTSSLKSAQNAALEIIFPITASLLQNPVVTDSI